MFAGSPRERAACTYARHVACSSSSLVIGRLLFRPSPCDVRQFVARQSELYSTPGSAGSLVSALRGYFRFRAACGDQVHALIGVVSYPATWQLSSLPKALTSAEVKRLVASLGWEGPSARRADAMVRCALDLGLRCGVDIRRLALLIYTPLDAAHHAVNFLPGLKRGE